MISDEAVEAARLALEDTALGGLVGSGALNFKVFARKPLRLRRRSFFLMSVSKPPTPTGTRS